MPQRSKKELVEFHALYLHHYGKNLTMEETEKRLDALVGLLRLVRGVEKMTPKKRQEIKEWKKKMEL